MNALPTAAAIRSCLSRVAVLLALCGTTSFASAEPPFTFEAVTALDDMSSLIQARFPLGASRASLRRTFVEEGHATIKINAGDPGIEKYIYDIDLCHYYVWRWNISADYDADGLLRQAYVNGNIVYPNGSPKKVISKVAEVGKKASMYRMQRPRPEAYKGESSLGFILFDRDSDLKTTDDQALIGAGPSRADPVNMGTMVAYTDIDPWRSIFDIDSVDHIAPYPNSCANADALMEAQKQAQKR
ncbi:MAG: hypothetical protein V4476_06475 [Pseudomonadota bacterium]